MNWLPLDQFRALIPLPPGLRVESMRSAHIAAAIASFRSWHPDIAYGSNSGYLRDELVGMWSPEREVDSLALYARVGAIAPHHAGAGLIRQITAGMEDVARQMGAAFMYAMVTLKHPLRCTGPRTWRLPAARLLARL